MTYLCFIPSSQNHLQIVLEKIRAGEYDDDLKFLSDHCTSLCVSLKKKLDDMTISLQQYLEKLQQATDKKLQAAIVAEERRKDKEKRDQEQANHQQLKVRSLLSLSHGERNSFVSHIRQQAHAYTPTHTVS